MNWPLEPGARMDMGHPDNVRTEPPRGHEIELSKAISLKRIADALDGTSLGLDITESLAGLTSALIYGKHK